MTRKFMLRFCPQCDASYMGKENATLCPFCVSKQSPLADIHYCQFCGREFIPNMGNQKYCNRKCRYKATRHRKKCVTVASQVTSIFVPGEYAQYMEQLKAAKFIPSVSRYIRDAINAALVREANECFPCPPMEIHTQTVSLPLTTRQAIDEITGRLGRYPSLSEFVRVALRDQILLDLEAA